MKREEQLAQTRQAILDAARELFLSKGFQETSTRDIAKTVGITQPALYHHFDDKEVIFLQVIQTVGASIKERIDAVNAQQAALSPEDRLTQITQILTDTHPRDIFTVIHSSFAHLKAAHQGQLGMLFQTDYLAPITTFFESRDVTLRKPLTATEAASFYMTSLSPLFSRFHQIGGSDLSEESRIRLLLDMILHGVVD